jgi:RHS repeat-associated protein
LVAVQNAAFTPQGYMPGQGGSNVTVPSSIQFVEMYNYTQAGLTGGKRLQALETFHWYVNSVLQTSNQTLNMDGAYTYNNEGKMTSVTYPTTYSNSGSTLVPNTGPTYTYSFDAMYRPTGLTDQNNNTLVNNVAYNPANQLLTFNTETRTYNNLNQMTRLTITGSAALDISYNFTAGANNGKISSQLDHLSMETVTYQYDSLNRLLSASSSQSWSETYGFDSFGNLLSKTPAGGAPALSQSVNTATNQIVGQTYDSNGNQLSGYLGTVTYDAENRIASMSSAGVQYSYDSRNKRVWSSTLSGGNLSQNFYCYGIDGQKLAIYPMTLVLINNVTPLMTDNNNIKLSQFFGHKRIGTYDRLGTAKYNQQNGAAQAFYPYGEDRGTVEPNDSLKFATYTRDAATGLDYADQRYYASNFGRMMSPDPDMASGGPGSPASWNRYTYAIGDPVNGTDPSGRYACDPDDPDCPFDECTPGDGDCDPDPCGPQSDIDLAPGPGPSPCEGPPPPPPPSQSGGGGGGGVQTPATMECALAQQLGGDLGAQRETCLTSPTNSTAPGTDGLILSLSNWNQFASGTSGFLPTLTAAGAGAGQIILDGAEITVGTLGAGEVLLTVGGVLAIEALISIWRGRQGNVADSGIEAEMWPLNEKVGC